MSAVQTVLRTDFLFSGGAVARYHTERIAPQSVAAHSWGVAAILLELHRPGTPSSELLQCALLHDVAEVATGDLPAPVKRRLNLGAAFDAAETEELSRHDIALPALTPVEAWLLKLADCLEGAYYCTEQARMGNRYAAAVGRVYCSYVRTYLNNINAPAPASAVVTATYILDTLERALAS
jgi:5'-deoxynucleotidase YfbR-like HD superfamily hydrolase